MLRSTKKESLLIVFYYTIKIKIGVVVICVNHLIKFIGVASKISFVNIKHFVAFPLAKDIGEVARHWAGTENGYKNKPQLFYIIFLFAMTDTDEVYINCAFSYYKGFRCKDSRIMVRCNNTDTLGHIKTQLTRDFERIHGGRYYVRAISNYHNLTDPDKVISAYPEDLGVSQVQFIAKPFKILEWA